VTNDYTIRWDGKFYQIDRRDIRTGMRKAMVRVEQRLMRRSPCASRTNTCACAGALKPIRELQPPLQAVAAKPPKPAGKPKRKPD